MNNLPLSFLAIILTKEQNMLYDTIRKAKNGLQRALEVLRVE